jgi:hypothetical protein
MQASFLVVLLIMSVLLNDPEKSSPDEQEMPQEA